MIEFLWRWIERRRVVRRRWQHDARMLAAADPINSYMIYEARRRAARSRAQDRPGEYWHWAKVASEVARIEPRAAMDFEILKAITDREDRLRRG